MLTRELSTSEGYARWAAVYDAGENPLLDGELRIVRSLLAPIEFDSVLDAGAGTGRYSQELAARSHRILAVDDSLEMLARWTEPVAEAVIERRRGSVEDPSVWAGERFDLVVCALTLCHIAALSTTVAGLAEAVAPSGHLLLTDFHPAAVAAGLRTEFTLNYTRYFLPNEPHSRDDYLAAVSAGGLEIVRVVETPMAAFYSEPPQPIPRLAGRGWRELPFSLIVLARRDDRAG